MVVVSVLEGHLLATTLNIDHRALDGVSFSGTRLTIRKDSSIVALHAAISNGLCYLIEDLLLGNVLLPYVIELELLGFIKLASVQDYRAVFNTDTNIFTSAIFLSVVKWSNSDANFHVVF